MFTVLYLGLVNKVDSASQQLTNIFLFALVKKVKVKGKVGFDYVQCYGKLVIIKL